MNQAQAQPQIQTLRPATIEQAMEAVRANAKLIPVGAGTKPALAAAGAEYTRLAMMELSGVLEYEPSEFVISVRAGTPVSMIAKLLAERGQFMPFDPPLARAGATIGGTLAAGLSGSGRLLYGGIRDFILGIRFIDGQGRLVSGGGKVVKNAAGFDLPKLFCGSMGRLGVLVETTFKVFPRPLASITLRLQAGDLPGAVDAICNVMGGDWAVHALDLHPPTTLLLRLAGDPQALPQRAERLIQTLKLPAEILNADEEGQTWERAADLTFAPADASLIKVPMSPLMIPAFEEALAPHVAQFPIARLYAAAGNVAWVAWPAEAATEPLEAILRQAKLGGLTLRGGTPTRMGGDPAAPFIERIKSTLDPDRKMPEF